MEKVTGIGGIFFTSDDPKKLTAWYQKHLGVDFGDNLYVDFIWKNVHSAREPGHTVLSIFKTGNDYFSPSTSPLMINFRVTDLNAMLAQLRRDGIWVAEKTEEYDYGKFGWCMDPEGNKIELWQPVDDKL
jgi:predicted enzyme related to lactoylglutathione lyase